MNSEGDIGTFTIFVLLLGIVAYQFWDEINFIVALALALIPSLLITSIYAYIAESIVERTSEDYPVIIAIILGIAIFIGSTYLFFQEII